VRTGLNYVMNTGTIVEEMKEAIATSAERVKEVSAATGTIAASAEQASATITEMTAFASNVKIKTEDAAQTSERQYRSLEALAPLISTLNEITRRLRLE